MNCDDVGRLMHAHLDGELELESSLAVEEHLAGCARCRAAWAGQTALRSAIARSCETTRAPAALRARLLAALATPTAAAQSGRPWRGWLSAAPGLAALMLAGWLVLAKPWLDTPNVQRVVFHIDSAENLVASLRTLKNHVDAEPGSKVVVVAHNNGVEFLLRGARDENGRAYEELVHDFRQLGVEFRVCTNTLTRRRIEPQAVIHDAMLVPSGIAEISRLQGKEGYVYLRL